MLTKQGRRARTAIGAAGSVAAQTATRAEATGALSGDDLIRAIPQAGAIELLSCAPGA